MDIFTKEKRSEVMSRVRNKDSKIELMLRKSLWKEGFRYRKNDTKRFGKPDIVLKKYKTVIFVDSCFWHGCKKHFKAPTTNKKFWNDKIRKNRLRDRKVNAYYKKSGWAILRFWEHEIIKSKSKVVDKVKKITGQKGNK